MTSLKDVAKEASVSIATVSRVLNNPGMVNEETRAKVSRAIAKLDFKTNRVARRLRIKEGASKIIGLVLPDISNPFYVDVLRGVEDYAFENEYALISCNFDQNENRKDLYLNILQSESIDGMVVAPVNEHDKKVTKLVESGMPIVCIDRGLTDIDADIVLVDNRKGAYDAVSHLIGLGHERIAFISGLPSIPTSSERLEGYKEALREHHIPFVPELIKYSDSKHESGLRLTRDLLGGKTPPTALFTGNNLITLGALEMIHSLGLSIPRDIAIVGFDDMYWSISLNPPLTAVRQPGYDIGRRGAELLLQRIKHPGRLTQKVIFNAELKVRKSCGSNT
jgi:LacI family transcriptional regulator/LacI family repressor for deo operon, udp, cdd, tsx, nupC, and nupG